MCIHILFSSAKCNVITAVQRLMCALTEPGAPSLAEGYLDVCPAQSPSSAPGAPLQGALYHLNSFIDFFEM